MKKDFITVTPDSGNGSEEVKVSADMNPQLKERRTTLTFSASGVPNKTVETVQVSTTFFPILPIRLHNPFKLSIGSEGELKFKLDFTYLKTNSEFLGTYAFLDPTSQIETIQGEIYNNNQIVLTKEDSNFNFSSIHTIRYWSSVPILSFLGSAVQTPSNISGDNPYLKIWINGLLVQDIALTK
jgi:hypothetical protein